MSGGHFNYDEVYLVHIAEQIEEDIASNISDTGYQRYIPETIARLKTMAKGLYRLEELIHRYDYVANGDTSETHFLEKAREAYKGEVK